MMKGMMVIVAVMCGALVVRGQVDPPVPHLLGLCVDATGSVGPACVGEQVTCLVRIRNDTLDAWLLQQATVDGVVVRGEPLLMNPGTSFDAGRVLTAAETVPGFFEVPVDMTLDRADGALLGYAASLRPFLPVVTCPRPALRARRRQRTARVRRARCVPEDVVLGGTPAALWVCALRDGSTITGPR